MGEKTGQSINVAVNAIDLFPGRVLLVKREIQLQTVPGQVTPQGVGRPPPYIFRQDSAVDRRDLLHGGDADEQERQARKELHRSVGQRRVQESVHNQLEEDIGAEDE